MSLRHLLAFVLMFLSVISLPLALAQYEVSITVKGGTVIEAPPQLYTDRSYVLTVTVLDDSGAPRPNAMIALTIVGPGNIIGDASARTGPDGRAQLRVMFDDVGTLQLYVDGSRAGRILIYYNKVPVQVIAYPLTLMVLLLAAALYAAYLGPLSLAFRRQGGQTY